MGKRENGEGFQVSPGGAVDGSRRFQPPAYEVAARTVKSSSGYEGICCLGIVALIKLSFAS